MPDSFRTFMPGLRSIRGSLRTAAGCMRFPTLHFLLGFMLCALPLLSGPAQAAPSPITAHVTLNSYAAFASQNAAPGMLVFLRSTIPNAGNNYGAGVAWQNISGDVNNLSVNLGTTGGYFTVVFNNANSGQASYCTTTPVDFFTSTANLSSGGSFDVTINCTVPDTIPPVQQSAATDTTGSTVTINFNENVDSSWAVQTEFTLTANGTPVIIDSVSYAGSTAVLTLDSPVSTGKTLLVSYTGGTNEDLVDDSYNAMANWSNLAVTDNSTLGAVATPTVTGISPSSGPATGGTTVTVTGTNFTGASAVKFGVSNASSFTVNSATQITATVPAGAAGSVDITVTSSGGTSATSASDSFSRVAATTTALGSSSNPSVLGEVVTFTATVSSGTATGTVSFKDGATTITGCGSATVTNGVATCSASGLAPGSHSVTGAYSGDATDGGSTSSPLAQTVNKAASSTALVSSANTSVFGQSVTLTATVSASAPGSGTPTGAVTFLDGGSPVGTGILFGGIATFTSSAFSVGSHSITTSYGGDANFNGLTASGLTQVVTKGACSTALTSSANPSVFGQSVTLTATVAAGAPGSGTPTGTVAFLDGGSPVGTGTLSGGIATFTGSAFSVGSHSITTSYGGDANFNGSTASGLTQAVNQAASSTALTSSLNPSGFGQSVTLTATVSSAGGTPTGTVSFYDGATLLGTGSVSGGVASFTTSAFNVSAHGITSVYGGAAGYLGSTSAVLAQTVNKATPQLSWLAPFPVPAGTVLDIRELNASANIPGTFVYTPASGTAISAGGGQTLSVAFTPSDTSNYTSASMSVSIDVQKQLQTITFPAPLAKVLGDAPFSLAASADSGLTVSYTSSNTAVATVVGSLVTITGAGVATITASQGGDPSYAAAASVNQPLVVGYGASTPLLDISTLLDGSRTRNATLNLNGSATAQNGIKSILVNGIPVTPGPDGSFSLALSLSEGNNNITVTVIDNSGLETTATRTVVLDSTAPVLTVSSPADNATLAASSATLTGALDNPGTVQVSVNGGPLLNATMAGNGFSLPVNLLPGSNTIQITATDLAGNSSSLSRTLVSDTANPSLAITSPAQDISTDLASVTIGGTVSANLTPVTITVTVDGLTFTPQLTDGAFQLPLDLPLAKQYAIVVTATDEAGNHVSVQRNVIRRGTPAITWVKPDAVVYGTALGATQLSATASVPGSFSYTPASGTALGAGAGQTLSVTFTPTDTANYAPATASVSIDVTRALPAITWSNPAALLYGTTLGGAQLNAAAGIAGSFSYSPAAGTTLGAGKGQSLSATFTPTDTVDYAPVSRTVLVDVNQATPSVTWTAPAAIVFGTALDATQLNAGASVPGSFVYTPAAGTVMNGGAAQTLSAVFLPTDAADYLPVSKTVTIDVNRAAPAIGWSSPAAIVYGAALGAIQLNATVNVAGSLSYSPAAGTLLSAGPGQSLTATFTPSDAAKYSTVSKTVSIDVNKATPVISWGTPAPVSYGTVLGNTQLNASASVPGTLVYTPASGTLLTSGAGQTLSVSFTPSDNANYTGASASVTLQVAKTAQSIGFAALAHKQLGDAPFVLAASSSSGLPVAFASSDSSVATVSGSTVTVKGEGTCTITASQAGDGNFAAAAGVNQPLVVRYNGVAPQLSISTLNDGTITHVPTLNITGSAVSQNGVASLLVNGTPVQLDAGNGFSLAVLMTEGRNSFVTTVLDNAGLETTDSRSITLDTKAPAITVSTPADNSILSAAAVLVTGYLDNPGTVSATVNGGSPQAAVMDGTGFSVTLALADGSNTLLIGATDLAGNSSTVKRTVVSDTAKPALAITVPSADTVVNATTMLLSGTVSDNLGTPSVTITLDGQSYTPQVTDGVFQQQLSLPSVKSYAITVTATDQAGNVSTAQRNVVRPKMLGDLTHDGKVDIADALKALQMAVGLITPVADDLLVGDVAPLVDGVPQPDGVIDIEDAYAILKKAVGLINF